MSGDPRVMLKRHCPPCRCAVHHVGDEEGDGEVQGHRRGRAAEEAVGGRAAATRGRAGGAGPRREFVKSTGCAFNVAVLLSLGSYGVVPALKQARDVTSCCILRVLVCSSASL